MNRFKINTSFSKLLMLSYALLILLITLNGFNKAFTIILSVCIAVIFFGMNLVDEIAMLFFSINFIAVISSRSYIISIVEVLFVLKYFVQYNKHLKFNNHLLLIIALILFSVISSLALGLSLSRPFAYGVNLLMMYSLFEYSLSNVKNNKKSDRTQFFLSFIFGFAISLVISLRNTDVSKLSFYNRFIGLWTDPNFIGLFVAISFSMIFSLSNNKIRFLILFSPFFVLFAYCAYLTYSRTFIFAAVVIVVCLVLSLIKNKTIKFEKKILFLLAISIFAFLIYTKYFTIIIGKRGIFESSGDRDFANGRIDDWSKAWEVMSSDALHFIFGIGTHTSHNTVFDLFMKYGVFSGIIALALILSYIKRIVVTKKENHFHLAVYTVMIFLVLVIYVITLPMLEDDILYLLIGIIPICFEKSSNSKKPENIFYGSTYNQVSRAL